MSIISESRAFASFPGIFYVTDDQGRLVLASPRFCTLVGRSLEDLKGRSLADVLPESLRGDTLEHERQVLDIGMPITRELDVPGRRGTTRTWLVTKYPLHDEDGSPEGVGTTVTDVTEQVRGRAAAQREATFVRQVFDRVPNLIYAKDRDGRFTLANRAMAELWGATPEELIGRTEQELGAGVEQVSRSKREDARVLEEGGEVVTPEEARRDSQGAPRWFRTTRHALASLDGGVEQLLGVATDITEYRNAQRARLELQGERMEAIGRLAGGIAHDFNNLLTVLDAGAELLRTTYGDDRELGFVTADISAASQRAARLTQHLLAYSRRQLLTPQRIDLDVAIDEVAGVLRRLVGPAVQLDLQLCGSLPAVLVDRASVEQILVNFASNARDAMPEGGTLRLCTRKCSGRLPGATHDGIVELVAEDTGMGIPPDVLDHVFEPFFTTKPEGKGTGLGLSTVYGIVRQSGGTVEVEQSREGGARFVVRLPATAEAAEVAGPTPHPAAAGGGEGILVVDDEAAIRRVVHRILERAGYQVVLADGLTQAERLVEHHRGQIDLMLVDIVMPEANGFEVARALRARLPAIPVLHMTGHTKDTLPSEQGRLEHGYLQKPFTRAQLLQRVQAALGRRSVRA